jgi:hypothetical protein
MWPEIKTDYERLQDSVKLFLDVQFRDAISDEYRYDIRKAIFDDVVAEVVKSSDFRENGHWTQEDIKLAVGRVLITKIMGNDR